MKKLALSLAMLKDYQHKVEGSGHCRKFITESLETSLKAYPWALQNPHLSAVISNLWDETFIKENLSLAGKKVELQPA